MHFFGQSSPVLGDRFDINVPPLPFRRTVARYIGFKGTNLSLRLVVKGGWRIFRRTSV